MLMICAARDVWQVFYHLGELDSALTYALGAGTHFNVDEQSEYVQTLIGKQQQELAGTGIILISWHQLYVDAA